MKETVSAMAEDMPLIHICDSMGMGEPRGDTGSS